MAVPRAKPALTAGRYGHHDKARPVPGGRARVSALIRTVQPVEAAVEDPYDGRERILVTVNRRTDILEMERSHDLISEAAYRTGRTVEAVFQRLSNAGMGSATLDRRTPNDPAMARDDRAWRMIQDAKRVRALTEGITRQLGMIDTRLLRRILGDRLSYGECADFEGKSGERGQRYVAQRFRDALEDLARAWTSKGPAALPPDDKYADRAGAVAEMLLDRSGKI